MNNSSLSVLMVRLVTAGVFSDLDVGESRGDSIMHLFLTGNWTKSEYSAYLTLENVLTKLNIYIKCQHKLWLTHKSRPLEILSGQQVFQGPINHFSTVKNSRFKSHH